MIPTRRGREVSRLEAFSDGVFAFSATLLVVSLEVPETLPELVSDLQGFGAFGLAFLALVLIWSVHNAFFRRYGLQDRVTVALNACLLFVVLFYVYPLKFVAWGVATRVLRIPGSASVNMITGPGDLAAVFMLYSAGFVAVFLCIALLYRHAHRVREELELDEAEANEARFLFRHYVIFVFVGLLSIGVAWTGFGLYFGLPGWIYSLLGPLCFGHDAWSRRCGLST